MFGFFSFIAIKLLQLIHPSNWNIDFIYIWEIFLTFLILSHLRCYDLRIIKCMYHCCTSFLCNFFAFADDSS